MRSETLMGWDAAWTPAGTGAWALAQGNEVRMLEPTPADPETLLQRLCSLLARYQPVFIALDLPMARGGVRGWRAADLATTRAFSRHGCPVHSPGPERPGLWGDRIVELMERMGYSLTTSHGCTEKKFAEVYPHTALLDIYRSPRRLPYKAGKTAAYWPELDLPARKRRLIRLHRGIWERLSATFILPPFPAVSELPPLREIKALEDLTDALVCLHAARAIRSGRYLPFGDHDAAIWNPPVPLFRNSEKTG